MKISSSQSFKLIGRYLNWARAEWRAFMVYGLAFSLLSLLVPLIVQLLVGNLMLVGLGLSMFTLVVLLLIGLTALQFVRFGQVILLEFLERQFVHRMTWQLQHRKLSDQIMFFEISNMTKTLSKWALDGFETFLALIVGPVVLLFYHPSFLLLSFLIWGGIYWVFRLGRYGQSTAIEESKQKYEVFFALSRGDKADGLNWIRARGEHFEILKKQIIVLKMLQVLGPLALLVSGALLFQSQQLSLGQFVAAELIGTGAFATLGKLGKWIELNYGLVTSLVKLEHALEEHHD